MHLIRVEFLVRKGPDFVQKPSQELWVAKIPERDTDYLVIDEKSCSVQTVFICTFDKDISPVKPIVAIVRVK